MRKSLVFGGTSTDLLASFSQSDDNQSWCWKMSQTSFEWADPTLLEVLPQSGMTSSGRLYQLHNVEHPTSDAGGLRSPTQAPLDTTCGTLWHLENSLTVDGLLPTPTKSGAEHRTRYSQGGRPLMYMIQEGLLPTPTVSDAGPAAILNENTNIVYTGKGTPRKVSNNGVNGSLGLARTVMLLPTPTVNDSKNNPSTPSQWNRDNSMSVQVAQAFGITMDQAIGNNFQLNPPFVEEMMGFPIGWTELKHSETQSSHSAQNGSDDK